MRYSIWRLNGSHVCRDAEGPTPVEALRNYRERPFFGEIIDPDTYIVAPVGDIVGHGHAAVIKVEEAEPVKPPMKYTQLKEV